MIAESIETNSWIFRPPPDTRLWLAEQISSGQIVVGAWLEYKAVGAACFTLRTRTANLERLAVSPGARRRGIASRLLAHAEDEARARGCVRIEAELADELGLGSMFQSAGFEPLSREMVYASACALRPFCRVVYSKALGGVRTGNQDNREQRSRTLL